MCVYVCVCVSVCVRARAGWDSRELRSSTEYRAQELCENRGGRPGLPVPNIIIVRAIFVDVKQH